MPHYTEPKPPTCDHCGADNNSRTITRIDENAELCADCKRCNVCETLYCAGCELDKISHGDCCNDDQNMRCNAVGGCGYCTCVCH